MPWVRTPDKNQTMESSENGGNSHFDNEDCLVCINKVMKDDKIVQCNQCQGIFHSKCLKLNCAMFNKYAKSTCKECDGKFVQDMLKEIKKYIEK
jgi:hypothetical protein